MSGFGRIIIAAVLAGAIAAQPAAYAGTVRHDWSGAKSAKYYEGRIAQGGRTYRFRTPDTSVVLEDDAQIVELRAVAASGRRTGPIATTATPLAPLPAESAPPAAQEDDDEAAVADELPAEAAAPAAEAPALEAATPGAPDENDPWPQGEPSVKSLNRVLIAFGAGREEIEAQAAVSKFDSGTAIGGTTLAVQHQPDGSRWVSQGLLAAHNFTTEVKEADASTGTTTIREDSVLRVLGQLELLYDFLYADKERILAFGGGATFARVPTLDVVDATTKQAQLETTATVGPHLAVQYGWLGEATQVGAQLFAQPFTLNSRTKGRAYGLSLFGRYFVTGAWSAEGMLGYRSEANRVERECESTPSCVASSKASSNVLQLLLGLGYEFR